MFLLTLRVVENVSKVPHLSEAVPALSLDETVSRVNLDPIYLPRMYNVTDIVMAI